MAPEGAGVAPWITGGGVDVGGNDGGTSTGEGTGAVSGTPTGEGLTGGVTGATGATEDLDCPGLLGTAVITSCEGEGVPPCTTGVVGIGAEMGATTGATGVPIGTGIGASVVAAGP